MFEDLTKLEFPSCGWVELPIETPCDLLCCTAAGPGGAPLRVMIDTGTDPSAIDAGLAQRLALRTGGSGLGQGAASNAVAYTEAVLPWLRLGDLVIRDLFAPSVSLSGLPFQIDVVLGYNVLQQVSMRIDYQHRRLILAHPDLGIQATPKAHTFDLTFFEHFPAIENLEVAGQRLPLVTIDTGSNAALSVGPDLAAKLGLEPGAQGVSEGRGVGFGGCDTKVLSRRYRQLRFGPFDLGTLELDALHNGQGDLGRPGRANIGNRLLERFAAVSLDYQRQQICFER